MRPLLLLMIALVGCRDLPSDPAVVDGGSDASTLDAYGGDKAAPCSSVFGSAITQAFGRLDGTVHAVIPPKDHQCAQENQTHLQLEIETGGQAYRIFVNVVSDQGPPDVYETEIDHAIVDGAWADGWHPGLLNDYVANLGLHSTDFTQITDELLIPKISDQLNLGDKISVFASSSESNADSAHLVHRVGGNQDGAIIVHPDGALPHWIVVRFDEQSF